MFRMCALALFFKYGRHSFELNVTERGCIVSVVF